MYPDAGIKQVAVYRFKITDHMKTMLLGQFSKSTISKKYIVVFDVRDGQKDAVSDLLHSCGRYATIRPEVPEPIRLVAGFESVYKTPFDINSIGAEWVFEVESPGDECRWADKEGPVWILFPQETMSNDDQVIISTEDIEKTIRAIQICVENDDTLKFRLPGKPFKSYTNDSMGFRPKSKEWDELIHIISLEPPRYYTGDAKEEKYSAKQKMKLEIDKKLLIFLGKEFGMKFPEKYKIFERVPAEGKGIYRLKLEVYADKEVVLENKFLNNLQKEKLRKRWEKLLDQHERDPYNNEINRLLSEVTTAAFIRNVITNEEAQEAAESLKDYQPDVRSSQLPSAE